MAAFLKAEVTKTFLQNITDELKKKMAHAGWVATYDLDPSKVSFRKESWPKRWFIAMQNNSDFSNFWIGFYFDVATPPTYGR